MCSCSCAAVDRSKTSGRSTKSRSRALRRSQIPVVVGVGHETDFTIACFAADVRAPTPTAAAELVSASRAELLARTAELALRATREALRRIHYAMQSVDVLARRLVH